MIYIALLVDMFASRRLKSDVIIRHHTQVRGFFDRKQLTVASTELGDEIFLVVDANTVELSTTLTEFHGVVKALGTCAAAGRFECDEKIQDTTGLQPLTVRQALEDLQQVMVCVPPGHLFLLGSFEGTLTESMIPLSDWVDVTLTEDGRDHPIRLTSVGTGNNLSSILDPHAFVSACIDAVDRLTKLRADVKDNKAAMIVPLMTPWAFEGIRQRSDLVRDVFSDTPLDIGNEIRMEVAKAMASLKAFATDSAPGVREVSKAVENLADRLDEQLSDFAHDHADEIAELVERGDKRSIGRIYPIVGELQDACYTMVDEAIGKVASLLTASRHGIMDPDRYATPET